MLTKRIFMLMLLGLLVGASSSVSASDQDQLQESLKKWQQLREKCQGNYSYTVRWSSFTGFGHETEIVVQENKVTERRYRSFSGRQVQPVPGKPELKPKGKTWVEKGKSLGHHKAGASPKTLDKLYAEAAEIVKIKLPKHERRYVRFNKQGLLLSCFTVDTRIADDAPTKGVTLSKIKLGMKDDVAKKIYKSPSGKAYPTHWGAPPRIQTKDLRPLPGGYGRGSSTLVGWIKKNLNNDKKGNVGKKVYKSPSGKAYPANWGQPPRIQTRDIRLLPGGYGRGSSTLAGWIQKNMDRDKKEK